jgi:sporulation protein YlmC with PRC-barrel domain
MFTVGRGAGTQRVDSRRRIEEESVASEERLRELEEKYEDYKVYDNQGSKIGKVDDLFVDETDREEYIGVKLGLLGRKSTLIPMEIVRVNEADRTIEVSESKDRVKDAPSFDDDEDITGDYERRIRDHFGLESTGSSSTGSSSSSGGYGAYAGGETGTQDHDDSEDYSSQTGTTDGGHTSESSSESTEHAEERTGSTSEGGGSQSVPEYRGPEEGSTGSEESQGGTGTFETGSSGAGSSSSSSSEGPTQGAPTSRQTEETETFQEGGRTKVRRRIVREEIVEEDPDSTQ